MTASALPPGGPALHDRAATFIVAKRWLWPILAAVLVALSIVHFDRILPPVADSRLFFSEENPDRLALDEFEATFSRIDNIFISVEPSGGEVFDPAVLKVVGEITEQSWRLPYVRRVDSITNFQHSYAEGDDVIVGDLVEDPANVTPETAARAKGIALEQVELLDRFITRASDVTMVQVQLTLPRRDQSAEINQVVMEVRALQETFEKKYPDIDLRLVGSAIASHLYAVSTVEDARNLMGPMLLAILFIIWLAARSLSGVLGVVAVIICASVASLGALGWMDERINTVTALSPLYVMVLAVAATVHMVSAVRQNMPESEDRKEWVRKALSDHMGAIIVTGVTTAIGFFCLNFSISPPLHQLGNAVGVGILATTVYTLTLLPSIMLYLPLRRHARSPVAETMMIRLAEFVIGNWKFLLPTTGITVLAAVAGVGNLKFEDDVIRYFDDRYEFRRDADFIESRLAGLSNLDFPLRSAGPQGINDPDFLAEVADFTAWLRAQTEVSSVSSLTDTIARLNMNLHGDDPDQYRIPASRDTVSELLFLYELSLGYGGDLSDRVDIDRHLLRVTVFMGSQTSAQMRDLTLRAGRWLKENAPILQKQWENAYPDVELITPTGPTHVFNQISLRDSRAMFSGTMLALVLISGIIVLALRDFRIGLVSLIPNLLPAAMAFGLWGYGVGSITLAVSVVVAATLGIVVDDTVHMLSKYSLARRLGKSAADSLRYVFRSVGMPIIVSSISLIVGFVILAQSGFAVNGDMAKLTAITIVLALLADLFFLPSLLIWWDARKRSGEKPAEATLLGGAALMTLCLAVGAGGAADALAETAEEKAMTIALEADRRDLGFGSYEVGGEMILRDQAGRESRRKFVLRTMERADPAVGDMSILAFREPRGIRGVGLLTHSNIEPKNDSQWLYLPTIKRVKRISSSNRSGKFMASEFSYEDLGSQEVGDYDRKWIRDEPCPANSGLTCFVLEEYPKSSKSGYSKRIAWIDTAEYRRHFVEFYNRRGELEKTLTLTGYRQYLDRYWRSDKMNMRNRQTGKSTELSWNDYKFRSGLKPTDFTTQRLKSQALLP